MELVLNRLYTSIRTALPKAIQTVVWLLKIMLPVGLAVSLLQYWGVIERLAAVLTPAFSLIGLPGEAAVVFLTSIVLNIYAAIAVIATLPLEMREITILAIMCLISHNMIVETTVQKKTGSSAFKMLIVRLAASCLAAVALNSLLPEHIGAGREVQQAIPFDSVGAMLGSWLQDTVRLVAKITLLVTGLMVLQNMLKEFGIIDPVSRMGAPLMRIMGLSRNTSFLWFVAQILGLAYGAAVLIEAVDQHDITPWEADLLNHHIAINHSLLEDTLLFVAIGVPALWITAPRLALAVCVVWGYRAVCIMRRAPAPHENPTAPVSQKEAGKELK